jgi:CheY-like chemotaxis protein
VSPGSGGEASGVRSRVGEFIEMIQMSIPAPAAGCLPGRGVATGRPVPVRGSSQDERPRSLGSSRRILVVDDHHDCANSLSILLRLRGLHVRTAYDGHAAFVVADQWRPDVAILDIGMPRMDGYELARRLRAGHPGQDIVLIALTGFVGDDYRRLSTEAGFNHHFVKPVSLDILVASAMGSRSGRLV